MMTTKWLVHNGNEPLGPWTPEEVREELRSGRIDAFDLVSIEGSARKRPLVDVDELFESASAKYRETVKHDISKEKSALIEEPLVAGHDIIRPAGNSDKKLKRVAEFTKPRAFEALAAPIDVSKRPSPKQFSQAAPTGSGVSPVKAGTVRRYVLWVKNQKPQGPFTSREVLTLWYSKKLPPDTIVQRAGQSKKITIESFARFYEKAAPSGIAFVGEARAAASLLDVSTRWLILAVILGVLIISAALLSKYEPVEFEHYLNQLYRVTKGDGDDATEEGSMEFSEMPTSEPQSSQNANPPSVNSQANPPKKTSSKQPQKGNSQQARPRTERAPRPVQRIEKTAPRPAPRPAPGASAKVSKKASGAPAGLIDGTTVTLSGYRFNMAALNACELKCRIQMTGPKGPVTAVFFKEAFADSLVARASGVTVTGTIRREPGSGGVTIFVQSVK